MVSFHVFILIQAFLPFHVFVVLQLDCTLKTKAKPKAAMAAAHVALLQKEGLVSLSVAAKRARLGEKTNYNLIRWHTRGCLSEGGARVYLQMVRVGSRFKTSHAAVKRFLDAINAR